MAHFHGSIAGVHLHGNGESQAAGGPADPSSVTGTPTSGTTATTTWAHSGGGETGFLVEINAAGAGWVTAGTVGAGVYTYSHTGLTAATSYVSRVTALGTPNSAAVESAAWMTDTTGSGGGPFEPDVVASVAASGVHAAAVSAAVGVADPPAGEVGATVSAVGAHSAAAAISVAAHFSASIVAIGAHAATASILAQVSAAVSAQVSAVGSHTATVSMSAAIADSSGPVYASQPDTAASWSYLQTGTLWALSGRDDWTGAPTYAAPSWFLCDYAAESRRMADARGVEFTSRHLVYTSLTGIKQGDMVLLAASSVVDPIVAGASEVKAVAAWADTFNAGGPEDFRIAT